jgi:hypothetical protein
MVVRMSRRKWATLIGSAACVTLLACLLTILIGCQLGPSVASDALVEHQQLIDLSGLKPMWTVEPVQVETATPETWKQLGPQKGLFYNHMQWRSPTKSTGFGIAHIRLPLPVSVKTLVWFAKNEYAKKDKTGGGKLIGQWTDNMGREWFEAENDLYHVKGYAIACGGDSWIVYWGYKLDRAPQPMEMTLAARAMETVMPIPLK